MTEEQHFCIYRHSRAHKSTENTFGILTAIWRILLTSIKASVENTEKYILTCLALHNYLRQANNVLYTRSGFIDSESSDGGLIVGSWSSDIPENLIGVLQNVTHLRGATYTDEA